MTTEEAIQKVDHRLENTRLARNAAQHEVDVLEALRLALCVGRVYEVNLTIILGVLREDES